MQSTTTTSIISPVHVKVAYENEFRRFLLNPVTFEQLETTLTTLFNINAEFRIKFQDDENDWVLLTTDQELVYATELSGSPLRLQVKLLETSVKNTDAEAVPIEKGRGRGGKGCRGRGLGRGGCKLSPEERLALKSSRLAERITVLESKLTSKTLPAERERVVRWRLTKLQEKLTAITAMKESLGNEPSTTDEQAPTGAPTECVNPILGEEEEKTSGRGGRRGGRGGRGGWRRAMMEDGTDRPVGPRKPRMDPEIMAKFRQCKADLQEARESGDAEKIEICLEAFKTAKATKMEARAALRAQQASTDEEKA
jgi:hypothetical protein